MESKKQAVNSFIKGMDKDIDISLLSKESYIDAQNFRLVNSTGNTSMSLEVVQGNSLNSSTIIPTGYQIVGYCNLRSTLVIFITTNTSVGVYSGYSQILSATVSDGSIGAFTTIYNDAVSTDGSRLGLNINNPVQAIGRYETNLIQKVYFCDGYNNLRFFNLVNIGYNQPVNQFDIIPNYTLSRPQITSLVYGDLPAGKIQYAYQLYNQNGAETLFSPCSSLVSLTNSNASASNNKLFVGDSKGTNSGCGVIFTIPSFTGFTKIRVISILYNQYNGIPSINIIAEENLPSTVITTPLVFTDFGTVSLGTYTYEEIAVIGRYLFVPQTIETKNNYLFAANINQQQWDVTYDARAFRWPAYTSLSGGTRLYDSTGNYVNISSPSSPPSLTHDCINPYNNVALDGYRTDTGGADQYYNYKYKSNCTTLGGEGPNVSYTFITNSFILDNNSAGNEISVTYPYTDFSNPVVEIKYRGYQRDEIYRFGVVFYDAKGRSSTVKWIGDIRFPSIGTYNIAKDTLDSSSTFINGNLGYNVGIQFLLNNIPAGVSAYQIVRCERTNNDKTVIAQGFTYPLHYRASNGPEGADTYYMHQLDVGYNSIFTDPDPGSEPGNIDYSVVEFVSPEVNINTNITYSTGDRLDIIGYLGCASSYFNGGQTGLPPNYRMYPPDLSPHNGDQYNSFTYKYYDAVGYPGYTTPVQLINITNAYITDPIIYGYGTSGLNINTTYRYKSEAHWGDGVGTNIGTKLIITLNSATTPSLYITSNSYNFYNIASQTMYSQMLANYRRMNGTTNLSVPVTTQYGGNTYYDRQNCKYIECSDVIPSTTVVAQCYSGDTYVAMYDYLRNIVSGIFATTSTVNGDRSQLVLYFPVETQINLRYRSDISFSKTTYDTPNATRLFMTEQAGSYGTGTPYQYNQLTNLYIYNQVYSQQDNTISFFPKNDNIVYGNQLFDSRIVVSDKKINGEESDSWLQFEVNNFLDVDTGYGPINSLIQFNDHLFFFQDNAFGDVSVSPRSLISDNNPGSLVLGTGAVLDRYDYISTTVGNKFKFGNVIGQNGIYWYDVPSKTIYNYSGSIKPLSKLKGLCSYYNTLGDANTTCLAGYDYKYNEVLFTITNSSNVTSTVAYSEMADSFISFYSYTPQWYINVYNKQLYTVPVNTMNTFGGNSLWLQNSTSSGRASFYGIMTTVFIPHIYSSTITYAINDNFQYTKVFDSIQYDSKSKTANGNDIFADTFNSIQAWNTKQNTGSVSIVVNNPISTTLNLTNNTFKREDGFITTLPRNIVSSASYANVNIFSSGSWDNTRTFQERLRDKYLMVQLTYNNNNSYIFSIPYITSNYRISVR